MGYARRRPWLRIHFTAVACCGILLTVSGVGWAASETQSVRPTYHMTNRLFLPMDDPPLVAPRFVQLLATRMQDFCVHVDGPNVSVHIGIFRLARTALHLFKGISSLHFRVESQHDGLHVDYDIRLTGLAWSFLVFGVLATAYSCSFRVTLMNILGPPCCFAVVFGLNWASARFAVRRFLRRVGRDVALTQD